MDRRYFVLALFFSWVSQETWAHQWPTFRNGSLNQGRVSLKVGRLEKDFSNRAPRASQTKGLIWGTSVIDRDGNIYVGSTDKQFYSFSPDGVQRWSYQLLDEADSMVDSAAALTDSGLVVVPGGDGYLHGVEAATGKRRWLFKARHASQSSHSSGTVVNSFEGNVSIGPNGLLYAGSDNGAMYAVDESGREVWSYPTKMMIWSAPAFDRGGKWMVFGSLDGNIYLLDPKTGLKLHQFNAGGEVKSSPCLTDDQRIIVGTSSGSVMAFDIGKSMWSDELRLRHRWTFQAKGEVYSSPACGGDTAYVGSLDGRVYALDAQTGNKRWEFNTYTTVAASPILSHDHVVIFGARNGKIYALNGKTGERIWSFETSTSGVRANLDASPAMGADGVIRVGSYSGKVFHVPYEFCLQNQSDARCEFGDTKDLPDFGGDVPETGTVFRFEDREGRLHKQTSEPVGLSEMIRLRVLNFDRGQYNPQAALNPLSVSIRISPEVPIEYRVSSDGRFLNVYPKAFFNPGTRYRLTVQGDTFHQEHWFWDRLKWLFLTPYKQTLEFSTIEDEGRPALGVGEVAAIGIRSLFLFQPQSLETYTPAALDGQAFVGLLFGAGAQSNQMIFAALPAYNDVNGLRVMPEPGRAFTMQGQFQGQHLRAEGKFRTAAMGGAMEFDKTIFSGKLDSDGNVQNGSFFAQTSCLSIQGNGAGYSFPLQLIDVTCDHLLRLIGVGKFEAAPVQLPPVAELRWSVDERGSYQNLTIASSRPDEGKHMVSYFEYEPATVTLRNSGHIVEGWNGNLIKVSLPKRSPTSKMLILYDGLVLRRQ